MFNSKGDDPFKWPFAQLKKRMVEKNFSSLYRLRLPKKIAIRGEKRKTPGNAVWAQILGALVGKGTVIFARQRFGCSP